MLADLKISKLHFFTPNLFYLHLYILINLCNNISQSINLVSNHRVLARVLVGNWFAVGLAPVGVDVDQE